MDINKGLGLSTTPLVLNPFGIMAHSSANPRMNKDKGILPSLYLPLIGTNEESSEVLSTTTQKVSEPATEAVTLPV